MADTPNTMPAEGLKPLESVLCDDRLAFRNALDLLFEALRADWDVHTARANLDTAEGQELGHAAASAWSSCVGALRELMEMTGVHLDLWHASKALLKTAPGNFPDEFDLLQSGSDILKLQKANSRSNPGLAALLFESYALMEAYRGNLALMAVQRAG
ncbi:hypothetical protein [uncultured Tateyamaria sp.]|uniref:hypothetical protein n=1 Tax=uncultured Tateyamaria sp. TaxID=455651 RepID=UPI00263803D5|nr:hypothetical protein [uncultured Tateyamaria sp.]